jgi:hypothetical protein
MRALPCTGVLRVPDIGRDASRPYDRNHLSATFCEINKTGSGKNENEQHYPDGQTIPGG